MSVTVVDAKIPLWRNPGSLLVLWKKAYFFNIEYLNLNTEFYRLCLNIGTSKVVYWRFRLKIISYMQSLFQVLEVD